MENYFEKFIKDEYEWLYECDDCAEVLIQDTEINEEELNEHLPDFIERAVKSFCDDEYIIQCLHDWMHDSLVTEVKAYLDNKK